jgi:hypothetical protein
MVINSGNEGYTRQGPILKYTGTDYGWGATREPFTELIQSGHVGFGMAGSSPRAWMTGVDGTVVYQVYDLTGSPVRCGGV